MYGIADRAKKIVDAHTFADCTRQLEVIAKLVRLQSLEITWTYSDATETNRRYEKEGEELFREIGSFVKEHGAPVEIAKAA